MQCISYYATQKQGLDTTLDSQASIPMATSRPSADQMLNSVHRPVTDLDLDAATLDANQHKLLERSKSKGFEVDPDSDSEYSDESSVLSDNNARDQSPKRGQDANNMQIESTRTNQNQAADSGRMPDNPIMNKFIADLHRSLEQDEWAKKPESHGGENDARDGQTDEESANDDDSDLDELVASNLDLRKQPKAAGDAQRKQRSADVRSSGEVSDDSLDASAASGDDDVRKPRRRTPSPVKSFLRDAGLTSQEATPAATPTVEHLANQRGANKTKMASVDKEPNSDDDDYSTSDAVERVRL